jgi:hypothetical protein
VKLDISDHQIGKVTIQILHVIPPDTM